MDKKDGTGEDYSLEILPETDFEEMDNDEEDSGSREFRLRRWQKVLLAVFAVIVIAAGSLTGSFFFLRARGEKSLKTEVPETAEQVTPQEREGLFITYNGKEYRYNDDIINFLCLGIDKDIPIEEKRETGSEGLADAVLLVSIDVDAGQISLLAIPRETIVPVRVQDTGGNFVKNENKQITLQYAYGQTAEDSCELMVDAVSNLLFKVPIQRYCSINFQAVPTLNDAIGGVDVEVLEDVWGDHCTLYAGTTEHLDGYEALDYIQWRYEWAPETSMGRLERQKQYMMNYFNQAKTVVKDDPTLPVRVFRELDGNMCTNITVDDLTYLVPELLDISLDTDNIAMIPGEVTEAGEYEEYHVYEDELKDLVISRFYEEVEPETDEDSGNSKGHKSDYKRMEKTGTQRRTGPDNGISP